MSASGTGKVAVGLARRGLSVLGVDVDERMAEVARGYQLRGGRMTFFQQQRSGSLVSG